MLERNVVRDRFYLISSPQAPQQYVVYDSLLEQPIGAPHHTIQTGMEMAEHLNRMNGSPQYL